MSDFASLFAQWIETGDKEAKNLLCDKLLDANLNETADKIRENQFFVYYVVIDYAGGQRYEDMLHDMKKIGFSSFIEAEQFINGFKKAAGHLADPEIEVIIGMDRYQVVNNAAAYCYDDPYDPPNDSGDPYDALD